MQVVVPPAPLPLRVAKTVVAMAVVAMMVVGVEWWIPRPCPSMLRRMWAPPQPPSVQLVVVPVLNPPAPIARLKFAVKQLGGRLQSQVACRGSWVQAMKHMSSCSRRCVWRPRQRGKHGHARTPQKRP